MPRVLLVVSLFVVYSPWALGGKNQCGPRMTLYAPEDMPRYFYRTDGFRERAHLIRSGMDDGLNYPRLHVADRESVTPPRVREEMVEYWLQLQQALIAHKLKIEALPAEAWTHETLIELGDVTNQLAEVQERLAEDRARRLAE